MAVIGMSIIHFWQSTSNDAGEAAEDLRTCLTVDRQVKIILKNIAKYSFQITL